MRLIMLLIFVWIVWSLCRMRDRRVFVVIPTGGTAQAVPPGYNPGDSITGISIDPDEPIYQIGPADCCKC